MTKHNRLDIRRDDTRFPKSIYRHRWTQLQSHTVVITVGIVIDDAAAVN